MDHLKDIKTNEEFIEWVEREIKACKGFELAFSDSGNNEMLLFYNGCTNTLKETLFILNNIKKNSLNSAFVSKFFNGAPKHIVNKKELDQLSSKELIELIEQDNTDQFTHIIEDKTLAERLIKRINIADDIRSTNYEAVEHYTSLIDLDHFKEGDY